MIKFRLLLVTLFCLQPVVVFAADISLPHKFSKGEKAVADEVNSNFATVVKGVNSNTSSIDSIGAELKAIAEVIDGGVVGVPGPQGEQGPQGIPGSGSNSNSVNLPLVGDLLNKTEMAAAFPSSALSGQACSEGSKVSASVTVGGSLNLSVTGLLGNEAVSQLFQFSLVGVSNNDVDVSGLIGSAASLVIATAGGSRVISGIATKVGKSYTAEGQVLYSVTIEPAASRLTLGNGYQIFQGLTVDEVVQDVFNNNGLEFSTQLFASYTPFDMSVMYDQSPWSYIQNLTEKEGIAYYFNGSDTVFFDNAAAYPDSGLTLAFIGQNAVFSEGDSYALSYFNSNTNTAGEHSIDAYNFETPTASLLSTQGAGGEEEYRFSYDYADSSETSMVAQIAFDRANAARNQHYGTSNSPFVIAGYTFNISASGSAAALSGSYVATHVQHAFVKSAAGDCFVYANNFTSMPSSIAFRPEIKTPRPTAKGVTTAMVVGPFGETRYTDEYGRIKVQFHWDRTDSNDENSSAFIRVVTPVNRIDDKQLYIPKIGTEVLVDFLDGDPSSPIVTGSIYNAESTPPVSLPDNKGFANNEPYGLYTYFAYTVGGVDGTLTQSIFETTETSFELFESGACSFASNTTYSLTQNAIASSSSVIDHDASISTKTSSVCSSFNIDNETLVMGIDGQTVRIQMDTQWRSGFGFINPANVAVPTQKLTFIYIIKQGSGSNIGDLPL